jgi:glucan phosphorylase
MRRSHATGCCSTHCDASCWCRWQAIENGFQKEYPDIWLTNGNPWELKRPNINFPVGFYGEVKDGVWVPSEKVLAETRLPPRAPLSNSPPNCSITCGTRAGHAGMVWQAAPGKGWRARSLEA